MLRLPLALLLGMGGFAGLALAETPVPAPIQPDSLHWVSPPHHPALQSAWIWGAETQPGLYLLRVKLAAGGNIPPHTHPDERVTTVLSGTLSVGFGRTFNETAMVTLPPGAVYVVPAQTPHYVWAKDGAVSYQEMGVGPTGTAFIPAGPLP